MDESAFVKVHEKISYVMQGFLCTSYKITGSSIYMFTVWFILTVVQAL